MAPPGLRCLRWNIRTKMGRIVALTQPSAEQPASPLAPESYNGVFSAGGGTRDKTPQENSIHLIHPARPSSSQPVPARLSVSPSGMLPPSPILQRAGSLGRWVPLCGEPGP